MYIPLKHSTQLSQTEEDSIISNMLTTYTNLPNTIITADVNAHSLLWYLPTEDHKGELIKDILQNSHHITLNSNTPTCLPPNQTQQPTSPDITTALANLHNCTRWLTLHSHTSDCLPLLTTLSIHHKTKTTHSHFTKTITNYQKANWTLFKQHVENTISCRPHSTNVHETNKHLIKAILDADRLFIPKGNHSNTIIFTCLCISTSFFITVTIFANKTDQTHKSLLLTII